MLYRTMNEPNGHILMKRDELREKEKERTGKEKMAFSNKLLYNNRCVRWKMAKLQEKR